MPAARWPLRWLSLSAGVVIADQLTKLAAELLLHLHQPLPVLPVFNLTLRYNPGAAFSFLADGGGWQRWFFIVLALAVSVLLIVWLRRVDAAARVEAAGLALVLGGAVGNVIDRIFRGEVVDFLEFHYAGWFWPAFNLADSAITVGVAFLLVDGLFLAARRKP